MTKQSALKVAITDDSPEILEMLRQELSRRGCEVKTFHDAEETLDVLGSAPETELPEVLIIDLLLPGLDGISLLSALKNDSRTAAIRTIVISALNAPEAKNDAFLFGAEGYIVKPFRMDDLAGAVMQAAGRAVPEKTKNPPGSVPGRSTK